VFLNTNGYPIAQTGPGSLGNETSTFGGRTYQALLKFQSAHNLPTTGFFGPLTRASINSVVSSSGNAFGSSIPTATTQAAASSTATSTTTPVVTTSSTTNTPCIPGWCTLPGYAPGQIVGGGGAQRDTTPPVITLNGANPMTVAQNGTFTDPGTTATDNVDGTDSVTTSGSVNTATLGTYTLTYTSTDKAGNTASVTRTVYVTDQTPPVISAISSGIPASSTTTITWTTNEPATSIVNYGTTVSYVSASSSATLTTNHSITLTGLIASTAYNFQIQSADASGNVATSSNQTFTTGIYNINPGISVTSLGTANSVSTTVPVSLTLTNNVPAGSLIVVAVDEYGNGMTIGGSVTDSNNATYTALSGKYDWNNATYGFSNIFYKYNSSPLSAGSTITFNIVAPSSGSAMVSMSAFYATGIQTSSDPLDSGVTATATGISSANPLVTLASGAPSVKGELFVSMTGSSPVSSGAASLWYGQDTTDGWQSPLASVADNGAGTSFSEIDGGTQVNAGTSAINFKPGNPNAETNITYSAWVIAFKPATQPTFYDAFAQKPNGAPGTALTGQTWAEVPTDDQGNPNVVQAAVANGFLAATDSGQAGTAAYTGVQLPNNASSMFGTIKFSAGTDYGGATLLANQTGLSHASQIGNGAIHVTFTNKQTGVSYFNNQTITVVASYGYSAIPTGALVNIGWWIDGSTFYTLTPDGVVHSLQSPALLAEDGPYVEFENDWATGQTQGSFAVTAANSQ